MRLFAKTLCAVPKGLQGTNTTLLFFNTSFSVSGCTHLYQSVDEKTHYSEGASDLAMFVQNTQNWWHGKSDHRFSLWENVLENVLSEMFLKIVMRTVLFETNGGHAHGGRKWHLLRGPRGRA